MNKEIKKGNIYDYKILGSESLRENERLILKSLTLQFYKINVIKNLTLKKIAYRTVLFL